MIHAFPVSCMNFTERYNIFTFRCYTFYQSVMHVLLVIYTCITGVLIHRFVVQVSFVTCRLIVGQLLKYCWSVVVVKLLSYNGFTGE